jgi:hypothetical protein
LASKPRSTVSPGSASKSVASGFPVWASKRATLVVIWASKSPRRFLGLDLKIKWARVCQLHHKTDEKMKTTQDTCRDLAACFTRKQVRLGFPSLASRLVEARRIWCTWHHHGGLVEIKLKTDESMRWTASNPTTPNLPFLLY